MKKKTIQIGIRNYTSRMPPSTPKKVLDFVRLRCPSAMLMR
jgi:hypothetical protein